MCVEFSLDISRVIIISIIQILSFVWLQSNEYEILKSNVLTGSWVSKSWHF